jgi:hypothetical protein
MSSTDPVWAFAAVPTRCSGRHHVYTAHLSRHAMSTRVCGITRLGPTRLSPIPVRDNGLQQRRLRRWLARVLKGGRINRYVGQHRYELGGPGRVSAGVLLEVVNHVSVAAISVVLYPILSRYSKRLAVGYVAARSIEAALFALATTNLLMLVQLSQRAANPETEPLSTMLLAGHDWNAVALPFVAFALGALILNHTLYQTR